MHRLIKSGLLLFCAVFLITACTSNPAAYEELRQQEHKDHLKQNGI